MDNVGFFSKDGSTGFFGWVFCVFCFLGLVFFFLVKLFSGEVRESKIWARV